MARDGAAFFAGMSMRCAALTSRAVGDDSAPKGRDLSRGGKAVSYHRSPKGGGGWR